MTGRKLPGGQTEQLAYNAGGQLIGKTDFAGKVTTYAYDQRGRLVAKTPDASLGEGGVTFSYPNELTKVSTRGSIQNITRYDAQRGWLDSVQTPNGTLEYNYDSAGNRTQLKVTGRDGGTRIANFTYDALNRVSQVTRPGVGTLATYSYNAVGNRTQTQRANGITSSYGYDDLHRLTGIEHKKGTEVLSQFAYTLNNDGKRGSLTEFVKYPDSQTVASINRTVHYGYDNAGRLIGEQRLSRQTLAAGGSVDKTAHTVWTYDKANNRTTQNLSNYDGLGTAAPSVLTSTYETAYSYNNNDWLQSQTNEHTNLSSNTTNTYTTNYEYNGNGSQSAVTTNVGTPDQKRTPYFYDFEEKLIGIGNPADTTKHAYAYDADGNRVTETNYNSGTPTTKHYLIDPNVSHAQVVEEFDSANQLLAHHDWDDAELLRSAVADSEGNAHITHPLADGHNSTRQLMDATGSIGGVLGYDAWGNAQESIGLSTAYRYNGQRLDASGLYHLRARQYAPWTGRFLSHDPVLGDMQRPNTLHRYQYSALDPVNFMDPSGRMETLASFANTLSIGMNLSSGLHNSVAANSYMQLGEYGMAGLYGGMATVDYMSAAAGIFGSVSGGGFTGRGAIALVGVSNVALRQVNMLVASANLTWTLAMAAIDNIDDGGSGSSHSGASVKKSGTEHGEAGKEWEEQVQRWTGGKSKKLRVNDNGEIKDVEFDSVTEAFIFEAKSTSSQRQDWWNKNRDQIRRGIEVANQNGKTYVVWFKNEMHPNVYQKIRENGGVVLVGEGGR